MQPQKTPKNRRGDRLFRTQSLKIWTVDPVSMGAKQKDALLLLQAFHHQLEKQLLIFNACNKCENIHVILNTRNGLRVIISLPLRCIFAFALSTLHIKDGRSRLQILSAWVQSKKMLFSCNRAFHHQLEKQLLIFNACNKCENIHVDLEYPKWPASHHLPPIVMHLCFCPFHPSY